MAEEEGWEEKIGGRGGRMGGEDRWRRRKDGRRRLVAEEERWEENIGGGGGRIGKKGH